MCARHRRISLLCAAVAMVALVLPASASAAPGIPAPGASHWTQAFPHCNQRLSPNGGPGGPAQCYRTFADAAAAGMRNPSLLGKTDAQVVAALAAGAGRTGAGHDASILLASDWKDSGFRNSNWNWYAGADCSVSNQYSYDHMPAGWNDVVSSARTWNNCHHFTHYENSYENRYVNGASIDCGYCSYVGDAMNDRTSSVRIGV